MDFEYKKGHNDFDFLCVTTDDNLTIEIAFDETENPIEVILVSLNNGDMFDYDVETELLKSIYVSINDEKFLISEVIGIAERSFEQCLEDYQHEIEAEDDLREYSKDLYYEDKI